MTDDHTPQTMAMQQLQGSGAGQMNDLVKRLRGSTINIGLVHEAADRIEVLSAALRDVIILTESEEVGSARDVIEVARAALAPEQDE
jgi:hypothetical protein